MLEVSPPFWFKEFWSSDFYGGGHCKKLIFVAQPKFGQGLGAADFSKSLLYRPAKLSENAYNSFMSTPNLGSETAVPELERE